MVEGKTLTQKVINSFKMAIPVAIVGGLVAIILAWVLSILTGVAPDLSEIITLVVSLILIILTGGMLKSKELKVLENIPNLVILVVSILIVNAVIGLIPVVSMISPYLLTVGEVTWTNLALLLAELMISFAVLAEVKKAIK